jgi:hypothetical protein
MNSYHSLTKIDSKFKMTIFQIPNPPLIAVGIGFLIEKFTTDYLQKFGIVVLISSLLIWSYQELTTGVNLFRKILGGIILLFILLRLFNEIN